MTFYEKVEMQIERRKARQQFFKDVRLFLTKCVGISAVMYVVFIMFY